MRGDKKVAKVTNYIYDEIENAKIEKRQLLQDCVNNERSLTSEENKRLEKLNKILENEKGNENRMENRKNQNLEFLNKVEKKQPVNDFEIRAVEDGQMVGIGDAPYNSPVYGGKTVTSFSQYVVDCIEKENPLMPYCDVLKCQSNIKFVIDKSPAKEAVVVKEGGRANFEQFEFDAVDVQVQKMLSICKFTNEIAQDSSINLPVHVSQKLAKSFALKMEHDMTDALVNANEAVSGALSYDELVKLQHSLPVRSRNGKKTVMVASSDCVLAMKLLKNQDGSSLMQPNPNNPLEFRVLGLPLVESPFLEAGTVVVADMDALFVGVSKNLEMTQLNELYAENGIKAIMCECRYAVHVKQNEKVQVFKVQ